MSQSRSFPSFRGPRTPLDALQEGVTTTIAGRWDEDARSVRSHGMSVEVSGTFDASHGDIVALQGTFRDHVFVVAYARILVKGSLYKDETVLSAQMVSARDRMNRKVRAFFHQRGFLEAETCNLVGSPGTDVYLEAFKTRFAGMGQEPARNLYLHTSPEFAMKRLLVEGLEKIFQICKVYRDGEWTPSHHPEFTMVEWYRAYADFLPIMEDVEGVVKAVLGTSPLLWKGTEVRMDVPFDRMTVQEAFQTWCGMDILACNTPETLRAALEKQGLDPLAEGGSWEDLFHELLVTYVEPQMGLERPVFLTHYPRKLAVLSRVCDRDPRVAERFELYIGGVELCNGFTELNDPVEQRARFQEDLDARLAMGLDPYPMPERFLKALERGMPPAGGVALGLDRLLMLATGQEDIGRVLMRA